MTLFSRVKDNNTEEDVRQKTNRFTHKATAGTLIAAVARK